MPKLKPPKLALLPMLLLPVLTGCASDSTLYVPPNHAPAIPPLPAQARQTDSPTFSASAQTDIEKWLLRLIEPSLPAEPAKPLTTH